MDDQVREAYKVMTETTRKFHEQIQRLIAGDTSARDGLEQLAQDVMRTHQKFMKAAAPYSRSGSRLGK